MRGIVTKFADLHIHTHFSDGTFSPNELIQEALFHGISCIAVTDHDTVDGIQPTIDASKDTGIEVIPGIELSSEIEGQDVHILGYFFDFKNEKLIKRLSAFQDTRIARIEKMIEKLHEMGIDNITAEEVCNLNESDSVGRPHLASKLVEKGWVKSFPEAFEKYLGDDCPAYVAKLKQTPYEAIELIKESGGVAVMAHPMVTKKDELIPSFVEAGLDGLEIHYPNAGKRVMNFYLGLASKHNLLVTGGSDAHGDNKEYDFVGRAKIPYEFVEELKKRAGIND